MRPSHTIPLMMVSYGVVFSAALCAVLFSLSGHPLDASLLSRPAALATLAVMLIAGWWIGSNVAKPWEKVGSLAEMFRTGKDRKRDPVLEIGEIVLLLEKGVEDLNRAKDTLMQAKKVQEYRRRHDERALERSRLALLGMLEDLEETNRKLVELDRFRNDFINITSHELKNPLTPMIANLTVLKQGGFGKLAPAQIAAVETLERNSERLRALVSDVLDISKLEGGRMKYFIEKIDLAKLARQCASDLQSEAAKKRIMIVVDAKKAILLRTDRNRVSQAVANYLTNAIKFSPQGGQIRVRVGAEGEFARLEVIDHGIGIPKAEQGALFAKFAQAKSGLARNRTGTGLGLAITKRIIEDLGGNAGMESAPGRGSVFYFTLPCKFPMKGENYAFAGGNKSI